MVSLVSGRNLDSGALQKVVDDCTQYRSRVGHRYEGRARQILCTDGFQRSETVIARQDHHQGLLDEKTERQVWQPLLPSKKSHIELSFRKAIRKQRRVL